MPVCNDCIKRPVCKIYSESLKNTDRVLFGCNDEEGVKRYKKALHNASYDKANTKGVYLKLNKKTDADIIALLADVKNKQGYIKELIRVDIAKSVTDVYATYPDFIKEG